MKLRNPIWILLYLRAATLSFGWAPKTVGLAWVVPSKKVLEIEEKKAERDLRRTIENDWGAKLLRQSAHSDILPKVIEEHTKKQSLLSLLDDIMAQKKWEISSKTQKLIDARLSHLTRGLFGPEIQQAKLVQAFLYWKQKQMKKAKQLFSEARRLHPMGEIFYPNWESYAASQVFESVLNQWQEEEKNEVSCLTSRNFYEKTKIWVNGFLINQQKMTGFQRGLYLVQVLDKNKRLRERVFYCNGQNFEWNHSGELSPQENHRLDQVLSDEILLSDAIVFGKWDVKGNASFWLLEKDGIKKLDFDSPSENLIIKTDPLDLGKRQKSFTKMDSDQWYNKIFNWRGVFGAMVSVGLGYFAITQLSSNDLSDGKVRLKGGR